MLGCESVAALPDPRLWTRRPSAEAAAAWEALRGLPESVYVGLALPRFLLRLPYGKDTDSTERFEFEELPDSAAHEDYLWANPAFAAVLLLAQTFTEQGWNFHSGIASEVDGLPIHITSVGGEPRTTPCAEVLLTQSAAERMMELGFMPLASLKDRAAIRWVRFQSISNPPRALAGQWSK